MAQISQIREGEVRMAEFHLHNLLNARGRLKRAVQAVLAEREAMRKRRAELAVKVRKEFEANSNRRYRLESRLAIAERRLALHLVECERLLAGGGAAAGPAALPVGESRRGEGDQLVTGAGCAKVA